MSKIFEALQKLERDLGKLPPGVSTEAQLALQSKHAGLLEPAPYPLDDRPEDRAPTATGAIDADIKYEPASIESESTFELSQVRVENVSVTPEARITYYSQPDGAGADRFRLLRMRLKPLWEAGKLKSLLVTSTQAQDGKSTVVMNLATALAEQGQKSVLVVEGDLYHPSLLSRLGAPGRAGLAECLEQGIDPLPMLRRLEPLGWYLLPAGQAKANPTELLQNPNLIDIFDRLRSYFDWIIIDTPPVVPLTDTLSLRQCADAALLVVRADRTPSDAVEDAIARFGSKNILGILLNGSDEHDRLYSDYRKSYGVGGGRKA